MFINWLIINQVVGIIYTAIMIILTLKSNIMAYLSMYKHSILVSAKVTFVSIFVNTQTFTTMLILTIQLKMDKLASIR